VRGADFPIFEPEVRALRRAHNLRDTDGDGVYANEARDFRFSVEDFRFRLGRFVIEMMLTEDPSSI